MLLNKLEKKEINIGNEVYLSLNGNLRKLKIVSEVDENSATDLVAADSGLGRSLLNHQVGDRFIYTNLDGSPASIKIISVSCS